jgi:hypothetical protein
MKGSLAENSSKNTAMFKYEGDDRSETPLTIVVAERECVSLPFRLASHGAIPEYSRVAREVHAVGGPIRRP